MIDEAGLEVMDEQECLELLSSRHVGRVAVTIGAVPAVFPVNFALLDSRIVFPTGSGTRLDSALRNSVVAFEVDDVDPTYHSGWSVLVVGIADVVRDPMALRRASVLPLAPWAPGGRPHVVALQPEFISGRRMLPRGFPNDGSAPRPRQRIA